MSNWEFPSIQEYPLENYPNFPFTSFVTIKTKCVPAGTFSKVQLDEGMDHLAEGVACALANDGKLPAQGKLLDGSYPHGSSMWFALANKALNEERVPVTRHEYLKMHSIVGERTHECPSGIHRGNKPLLTGEKLVALVVNNPKYGKYLRKARALHEQLNKDYYCPSLPYIEFLYLGATDPRQDFVMDEVSGEIEAIVPLDVSEDEVEVEELGTPPGPNTVDMERYNPNPMAGMSFQEQQALMEQNKNLLLQASPLLDRTLNMIENAAADNRTLRQNNYQIFLANQDQQARNGTILDMAGQTHAQLLRMLAAGGVPVEAPRLGGPAPRRLAEQLNDEQPEALLALANDPVAIATPARSAKKKRSVATTLLALANEPMVMTTPAAAKKRRVASTPVSTKKKASAGGADKENATPAKKKSKG